MFNSVPLDSSHTMDVDGVSGPHSSRVASFPGRWLANQHAVAIDPSDIESVLNLFSSALRSREGGGMKSHGSRTKSSRMRLENCLSRVQVPTLAS